MQPSLCISAPKVCFLSSLPGQTPGFFPRWIWVTAPCIGASSGEPCLLTPASPPTSCSHRTPTPAPARRKWGKPRQQQTPDVTRRGSSQGIPRCQQGLRTDDSISDSSVKQLQWKAAIEDFNGLCSIWTKTSSRPMWSNERVNESSAPPRIHTFCFYEIQYVETVLFSTTNLKSF